MFYTVQNQHLITAPSLACLLRKLTDKPAFNPDYLRHYFLQGLHFRFQAHHQTLYQNIYRLLPDHELKQMPCGIKPVRSWSIQEKPDLPESEAGMHNQFKQLLLSSVKQGLPKTGNVGVELSGGLDSSSVAALLRECMPHEAIYSFTQCNPKPQNIPMLPAIEQGHYQFDETLFSRAVNQHLDLKSILLADDEPYDFRRVIEHHTEILGAFSEVSFPILHHRCYEKARDLGVSTLFSGFGGDEMVTQNVRFYLSELKAQRQWVRYVYERLCNLKNKRVLARFNQSKTSINNLVMPTAHVQFLQPDLQHHTQALPPVFLNEQAYEYALIEGALSSHVLRRVETSTIIAAHYGIHHCFPLLNPALLQFFHHLPTHLKRRHGIGRYLMRQTMKKALPKSVVWRKDKSGLTAPSANAAFLQQLPMLFLDQFPNDYTGTLNDYVHIPSLKKHIEAGYGFEPSILRLALAMLMFNHLEQWLKCLYQD